MTGSEKQIKWANDIINEIYANLNDMEQMTQITKVNYSVDVVKAMRAEIEQLFADPRVTASMIIDVRGRFSRQQLESQAIDRTNLTK